MFNLFKSNPDFKIKTEIHKTKIEIRFFLKKNDQQISLPLRKEMRAQVSKEAPKRAAAFLMMESFFNNLVADYLPDSDFGTSLGFSEDELKEKPISFEDGALVLSFPFIYAVNFSSEDTVFGLTPKHLFELGVPAYSKLNIELKPKGMVRYSDFKIDSEIRDSQNDLVDLKSAEGSVLTASSGSKRLLLPSQADLLRKLNHHSKVCQSEEYLKNMSLRLEELARVRSAGMRAKAKLHPSIRDQDIIILEDIEYEIGRGLEDEIVLSAVMPNEFSNLDVQLQDGLNQVGDTLEGKALNFKNSENKNVRVVFKSAARERLKKINEIKALPQEKLEEVILDPTSALGKAPREKIDQMFSERVGNLIFGKGSVSSERGKGSGDWAEGFEGQSVFFRDAKGSTHKFDPNPTPEVYEKLKGALLEHEKISKINGDVIDEELAISVEGFENPIPFRTVLEICKRVEGSNTPALSEEDLEIATAIVDKARAEGRFTLQWPSGDTTRTIPTESLAKALSKDRSGKSFEAPQNVTLSAKSFEEGMGVPSGANSEWRWDKPTLFKEVVKPSAFNSKTNLRPHQEIGASWLKFLSLYGPKSDNDQRGAIVADDMGVGKTIQVLALIADNLKFLKDNAQSILIVAPVSLLKSSWLQDGFLDFFRRESLSVMGIGDGPPVVQFDQCPYKIDKKRLNQEARIWKEQIEHEGKALAECEISSELKESVDNVRSWMSGKIVLCSYETMRINSLVLGSVDFKLVVLDEAQKIKNENALQSNAAKALKSDMNIAMSGTPIENSLMDLWNLVDFAVPGKLGTRDEFRKKFVIPLKEAESGSTERDDLRRELERSLHPIWLRRTKMEVFGGDPSFPKIVHHDDIVSGSGETINEHMVPMGELQFLYYSDAVAYMKNVKAGERLAARSKMIQICLAPWLYLGIEPLWQKKRELFDSCPKLEVLISILEKIRHNSEDQGQKVLLFVNLLDVQASLATFIEDWHLQISGNPLKVYIYNGEVKSDERDHRISEFKRKAGFQVLIISPRSGGVGLNLQEANHVIHYTREWNPAVEAQATARSYRLKQTRTVHVYYPTTTLSHKKSGSGKSLVCAEEHIAEVLRAKREVIEDFTISVADMNIDLESFDESTLGDLGEKDVEIKIQDLTSLDPIDFEKLVSVILEMQGFKVCWVGKSRDRGADVLAFKEGQNLLIQCKHTSRGHLVQESAVGEPRQAESVYNAQYGKKFSLVLTTTNHRFHERCFAYAELGSRVLLWDNDWFVENMSGLKIMLSDLRKVKRAA